MRGLTDDERAALVRGLYEEPWTGEDSDNLDTCDVLVARVLLQWVDHDEYIEAMTTPLGRLALSLDDVCRRP